MKDRILTVITCNAAGGKPLEEAKPDVLGGALAYYRPDFIFLQELTLCSTRRNIEIDTLGSLSSAMASSMGKEDYRGFFVPAVDTEEHPGLPPHEFGCTVADPRGPKWYRDPFLGHDYAAQGNGFLIRKDWQPGEINTTTFAAPEDDFKGNRDTEPRILVSLWATHRETEQRVLLACTHLTTLRDEHKGAAAQAASDTRTEQVAEIVEALDGEDPVILAGDFNVELDAPELKGLWDAGLRCLTEPPQCSLRDLALGTHVKRRKFIDHIWYRGKEWGKRRECYLLRGLEHATDHRPVLGYLTLRT